MVFSIRHQEVDGSGGWTWVSYTISLATIVEETEEELYVGSH